MSRILYQTRTEGKPTGFVTTLKITRSDIMYGFLCFIIPLSGIPGDVNPLVPAVYVSAFDGKKWPFFFVLSILGVISSGMSFGFVYGFVFALSTLLVGVVSTRERFRSICVGALVFVGLTLETAMSGGYSRDYISVVMESLMCSLGVYAFSKSVSVVADFHSRRCVTDGELASLMVVIALVIKGLHKFPLVAGMDISVVLSLVIILIAGSEMSVAHSTLFGVVLGICAPGRAISAITSVGAYSLVASLSGLLGTMGRWGSALGMMIGHAVITVFWNADSIPFDIFETIAASILYSLLPSGVTGFFAGLNSKTVSSVTKAFIHDDKVQRVISRRLSELSGVYLRLAKAYDQRVVSFEPGANYLVHMLDSASSRVCSECSLRYNCWERGYKESYKAMLYMLNLAEKKGMLSVGDLPEIFEKKCVKAEEFVQSFNRMFELYRLDKLWRTRLNEARTLVSCQLKGISNSIENVAGEFEMNPDIVIEQEIKKVLDKNKIPFSSVTFLKGDENRFSLELSVDKDVGYRDEHLILTILETTLSQGVALVSRTACSEGVQLRFCSKAAYRASFGRASVPRHGEKYCGDSTVCRQNADSEYFAILSDGMGSGVSAHEESSTVSGLFSDFMEAGMDCATALDIINSFLLLRSSDDRLATMDICSVNLNSGMINLYKSGAVSGYVRIENEVFVVPGDTSPFGLAYVEASGVCKSFFADKSALLVMVSDGIRDALGTEADKQIVDILNFSKSDNPQKIASAILNLALELCDSCPEDDMTVVSVNVWKK